MISFKNKCKKKQKKLNVGVYSDIYRPISFKLFMMIRTINPYILISVWMTLTFIQGNSCIRKKKLGVHFLANTFIDLNEIQYVATTCWFVGARAKCILHK